jgi:hypothetical protein
MKWIVSALVLLLATALAWAILATPVARVPLSTRERFPAAIMAVLVAGAIAFAVLSIP